jgi:hypothetical protein
VCITHSLRGQRVASVSWSDILPALGAPRAAELRASIHAKRLELCTDDLAQAEVLLGGDAGECLFGQRLVLSRGVRAFRPRCRGEFRRG